eukprot:gene5396-5618_t
MGDCSLEHDSSYLNNNNAADNSLGIENLCIDSRLQLNKLDFSNPLFSNSHTQQRPPAEFLPLAPLKIPAKEPRCESCIATETENWELNQKALHAIEKEQYLQQEHHDIAKELAARSLEVAQFRERLCRQTHETRSVLSVNAQLMKAVEEMATELESLAPVSKITAGKHRVAPFPGKVFGKENYPSASSKAGH